MFVVMDVCHAAIEFSAYNQTASSVKFVVTDTDDGSSSGWLALGEAFKDYTITAFDGKREVLSVRQDGRTTELALTPSRVRDGKVQTMKQGLDLKLSKDGSFSVDARTVTLQELFALCAAKVSKDKETSLHIATEAGAPVAGLAAIMDTCRKAGINRFSIGSPKEKTE